MAQSRKTLTLAGIALLLVSTAGGLPAAQSIDPTTGAVVFEAEPVRFEPEIEKHRLDVEFDGLILADIAKYPREVATAPGPLYDGSAWCLNTSRRRWAHLRLAPRLILERKGLMIPCRQY